MKYGNVQERFHDDLKIYLFGTTFTFSLRKTCVWSVTRSLCAMEYIELETLLNKLMKAITYNTALPGETRTVYVSYVAQFSF